MLNISSFFKGFQRGSSRKVNIKDKAFKACHMANYVIVGCMFFLYTSVQCSSFASKVIAGILLLQWAVHFYSFRVKEVSRLKNKIIEGVENVK